MTSNNDHKVRNNIGIQITLESNYILWAKLVRVYIKAKGKLKHLVQDPPP